MSVETGPIHPSSSPRDPRAGQRAALPEDVVRRAPKALLHDHLDGGLRPATIIELAAGSGYDALPSTDPEELGRWFIEAADSGSLVRYLVPAPEGAEYVAVCLPAFAPDLAHRDD